MKILFDHQIFNNQVYGGISRFFYSLMNQFYKTKDIDFYLSLIYSHNAYLKNFEFVNFYSFLNNKSFKGRDRLLSYFLTLNRLYSVFNLKYQKYDIFHPTEYSTYFLEYLNDKPFILTVHDMIHEIYNKDSMHINRKKTLIQKAAKIIAISQNTKKDILRFIDIPSEKIEVIYLASSFDLNRKQKILLPEDFLLFVGNRGDYKNFDFFLRTIVYLLKKNKSLFFVCVGGRPFISSESDFLKDNNLEDRVLHFNLTDEELAYTYSKALAFVFPSLYEGFGIPILEAFSCGCPVILSNTSCFPEIAQDAAIYFDPNKSGSILETVNKILFNKKLRAKKIKQGFKRLQDFSWQKTAIKTKEVYKSIL